MKNKNILLEIIFLLNHFFIVLGFFMHFKNHQNFWSLKIISVGITLDIILSLIKNLEKNKFKTLIISTLKILSIIIFLFFSFEIAISFFITILLIDFLSPFFLKQ